MDIYYDEFWDDRLPDDYCPYRAGTCHEDNCDGCQDLKDFDEYWTRKFKEQEEL